LCYTTGRTANRVDLGVEQRELLARVLGMEVPEEQATDWAAQSQADEPVAEATEEAERPTLGDYELRGELGRGAMGVVHRAWQPSLGRKVALKVLSSAGNERMEERFRREIRALGRAEYPHLVKVFASGSAGDRWFYVMELVDGAALSAVWEQLTSSGHRGDAFVDNRTWLEAVSTVCEKARRGEKAEPVPTAATPPAPSGASAATVQAGPMYARRVVELVRQVAEAAHALHEKGILHRDIKPGNIMVTADGGSAVLIDAANVSSYSDQWPS
jgi:eukaryotic-like serine/threonine-protein kinase